MMVIEDHITSGIFTVEAIHELIWEANDYI